MAVRAANAPHVHEPANTRTTNAHARASKDVRRVHRLYVDSAPCGAACSTEHSSRGAGVHTAAHHTHTARTSVSLEATEGAGKTGLVLAWLVVFNDTHLCQVPLVVIERPFAIKHLVRVAVAVVPKRRPRGGVLRVRCHQLR